VFFPTVDWNVGPVSAATSLQGTVAYGTVTISGNQVSAQAIASAPYMQVDLVKFGTQRPKIYRENVASGQFVLNGQNNVVYSTILTREMIDLQNLGYIDIAGLTNLNQYYASQLTVIGANDLTGPIPPASMQNIQSVLNALIETYNQVLADLQNMRSVVADILQELYDVNSAMQVKYGLKPLTIQLKDVTFAPVDYWGNSPPPPVYAVEDTPPYYPNQT
jgi:hypothetical protein